MPLFVSVVDFAVRYSVIPMVTHMKTEDLKLDRARKSKFVRRPLARAISTLLLGGALCASARASDFPATINLGSLNGSNGFRIDGSAAGDRSGFSVSTIGDVNGDGFSDVIVGAIGASSASGNCYVVFGKGTPLVATLDLSSLDGGNGFRLDGPATDDRLGFSVRGAGDVNGDGIDDLIVGADRADMNGTNTGSSYVVFGRTTPFAATLALSSVDGTNGFRIDGAAAFGGSGRSVSAAGDLNGDGIGDLIIGAPYAASSGSATGSSYVVFGKSGPFAGAMSLSSLTGDNGFRIDGVATDDLAGITVGAAGDINGDGIDDVIVGAPYADPNGISSGSSYVVFGKTTPFAAILSLASLDGNNGFRLDGAAAGDFSGFPVSAAGDVNGDGIDDLVAGAFGADPNGSESGSSYVVFGKTTPFTASLALGRLDGSDGFRLDGVAAVDRSGYSASAAGDVNGDGLDDLIIGAYLADPNGSRSGSSYVVYGKTSPFTAALKLSTLDGANGFRLDGAAAGDDSGAAVSAAGDVNGDGIDDLIIGANRADPNGSASGSSYVLFGRETSSIFKNGFE